MNSTRALIILSLSVLIATALLLSNIIFGQSVKVGEWSPCIYMNDSFIKLGEVGVHTTQNKGHDPEFWAEQATKKICEISMDAPEHVKQQAMAFQNQVYTVILHSIKNAINSKNVTYVNLLRQQGHEDMANIIKEL